MAFRIAAFFLFHSIFFGAYFCIQVKSFGDFLEYNHLKQGIIIMCNDDSLQMEELKAISKKSLWLSYIRVGQTTDTNMNNADFKDLFRQGGGRKVGVSFDIECQSATVTVPILESVSANNFFNSSQAWFILAKSFGMGLQALEKLEINIDADITLGIKIQKEDILRLYDLYKVCHQCGTSFESLEKGSWSDSGGMQVLPYFWQTTVQRRRNFSDITLNGGVVINAAPKGIPLSVYIESYKYKHLDTMQRKTYHLLKIMKEIYNFRIKIVISDLWGVRQNGNWTGIIGKILNGEVAITLSPLRFTQQRVLVVRYLPEVHVEIARFLFRHPRRSPIRNKFLEPFTPVVWYTVFAITIAGVFLMAITMHHEFENYESVNGSSAGAGNGAENKLDFFTLIILEAIFLQGPSQMFQFVSTRTLIISICIFAVMLNQFYSAFIVGSLLADVPRTIVSMPALFNSSLDVGMENIAYNYELFINTSNQMAKDIYVHRIMRNPQTNILPLQKGLERIARGGYAFHVTLVRAYHILKDKLTEQEFCDLQEVAMEQPFPTCAAVPQGSPYKDHFASSILQLRETGLMAYHDKLWAVDKPQCSAEMMEKDTKVDMEHFVPALGLLSVAMLTSWMILIVENLVHRQKKIKISFSFKQRQ
uniref:Putative ionotropic receptor IR16 n=1 Tax=Scaeva pyrastri TaxID=219539 RepID=A0A1B3B7D9_SCAPY|nr:putative ionotropic receptor IR16 [Scaeva pyrastri]